MSIDIYLNMPPHLSQPDDRQRLVTYIYLYVYMYIYMNIKEHI